MEQKPNVPDSNSNLISGPNSNLDQSSNRLFHLMEISTPVDSSHLTTQLALLDSSQPIIRQLFWPLTRPLGPSWTSRLPPLQLLNSNNASGSTLLIIGHRLVGWILPCYNRRKKLPGWCATIHLPPAVESAALLLLTLPLSLQLEVRSNKITRTFWIWGLNRKRIELILDERFIPNFVVTTTINY